MKKLKPHPHVIKLIACVTESGTENIKLLMSHAWLSVIELSKIMYFW